MSTAHDTANLSSGRRWRANLVALGAAAGMTLAGFGIAGAQTDDRPPREGPLAAEAAPAESEAAEAKGRRMRGPKGGGPGLARGALHGEFVTHGPDGGYQTLATQRGEVTEVSGTSLTVKSEDGYSRTYAVTDDTLVNAGDDGIADVAEGDEVAVTARVADGTATALDVRDLTKVRELRQRWAPRRPAPETGRTSDVSG